MISEFCVNYDHPAVQGHFPGNPIVPGALILEYVMQSVLDHLPDNVVVSGFSSVKYLLPVLPGQVLQVELFEPDNPKIEFKVMVDKHVAVTGSLTTK